MIHAGLRDRSFGAHGEWNFRRCRACLGLWLDPRPVATDRHLAYDCYYTHESGGDERSGTVGRLRTLRNHGEEIHLARHLGYPRPVTTRSAGRLVAGVIAAWPGRRLDAEFKVMRLRYEAGGRVLDVGAGDGSVLARLRDHGWTVRGVDVDAAAAHVAAQRGVRVDLGDLGDLGYADASFDAVVTSHVVEHVEDPRQLLAEMRRVLRPGGQFMAVTPNAQSLLHRRYGADWQGLEPPRHLQIFTRDAFRRMAEGAGFDGIAAVTTARSANGVVRTARQYRREDRWDIRRRPSLAERVAMELTQEWEALLLHRDPDAGEEIALAATRSS